MAPAGALPRPVWITDQPAGTQVRQWIDTFHRRQAGDPATPHRHHDLAAGTDVAQVAAELIMQLAHADLGLQIITR